MHQPVLPFPDFFQGPTKTQLSYHSLQLASAAMELHYPSIYAVQGVVGLDVTQKCQQFLFQRLGGVSHLEEHVEFVCHAVKQEVEKPNIFFQFLSMGLHGERHTKHVF